MRFHLGLIFAGLVFFACPNFNLLDIVPDFIGALLIMAGLSKIKYFDGNFKDARSNAKFLLWISLLRLVLCMWANSGHRDYLLPFTFIICVLEAIYMIALFRNLYTGAEYTLMRADCEHLSSLVNETFTFSFIFVLASRALEFAPCITDIIKQDAELDLSAGASFKMSMAQMRVYVLGACLVFSLILGFIFLFMTARCWKRLISEKKYGVFLSQKFDSFLETDRDVYVCDKISRAYVFLTFGAVFLADFVIDGINVIPTPVGTVLIFACCCYTGRLNGKRPPYITALSALITSVLSYAYATRVNMGINHLYALESFGKKEFLLLSQSESVTVSAVLSVLEFVCVTALIFSAFSGMIKLFENEKRKNAIPHIRFARILFFICTLLAGAKNVLRTYEGHYSAKYGDVVAEYVRNKAFIINEENYRLLMENPLIAGFESINSAVYYTTIASFIACVVCVLYLLRIWRVSEGR